MERLIFIRVCFGVVGIYLLTKNKELSETTVQFHKENRNINYNIWYFRVPYYLMAIFCLLGAIFGQPK